MKIRYKMDCTEWDSQVVRILIAGCDATRSEEKRKRYNRAIELIADAYLRRTEDKTEKVFDVSVVRKSTVSVVADNEDDASAKAAGIDARGCETVTTEVK